MVLKGIVEEIIFYNEENGYAVLTIDCMGEPVILTGSFINVQEGMIVEAHGSFVENPKYGKQFKSNKVSVSQPISSYGIAKFLASGLIKGVGEVTARNIVETFKDETLNIIENNPELLINIRGISPKKAQLIANSYLEVKNMQNDVMFLQGYEISANLAVKIYSTYKEHTRAVLLKNPYRLVEDVDGIGFLTADNIARKIGIDNFDEGRIRAGVIHILKNVVTTSGSTYIYLSELIDKVESILNIDLENTSDVFSKTLLNLELGNIIVIFNADGVKSVAFKRYYDYEKETANELKKLEQNQSNIHIDIEADISEFERVNNITLHESQKQAIIKAISSGVFVITGGPGTGKTTIINLIVKILEKHNYRVELVAPTGRAAKRLSLATEKDAKTIHRFLGYDFVNEVPSFIYNKYNKLDVDVVIVDEISMVDVFLMRSLSTALPNNAKLILVGDKDQLPSVGAGNVLKDIIQSGLCKVAYLTHIYRQGENSLITKNAHLINSGKLPIFDNKSDDFFFLNKTEGSEILSEVLSMFTKRIPSYKDVQQESIQILTPVKKGTLGTININRHIQQCINPKKVGCAECVLDEDILREGDRVIHTVNNYELEWQEIQGNTIINGKGVFNGDIGYINEIDSKNNLVTVCFEDGKIAKYTLIDCKQLMLAYAISVHKSQGSEFDVVILPLNFGYKDLYTRNLLYTAITRAKKMLVIISDKRTIAYMINNDFVERRYSMLGEFLK